MGALLVKDEGVVGKLNLDLQRESCTVKEGNFVLAFCVVVYTAVLCTLAAGKGMGVCVCVCV